MTQADARKHARTDETGAGWITEFSLWPDEECARSGPQTHNYTSKLLLAT